MCTQFLYNIYPPSPFPTTSLSHSYQYPLPYLQPSCSLIL
jgi:hypothetical protein